MHTINYTPGELWLHGSDADEVFIGDPSFGARNIFWMGGGNDHAIGSQGNDIFFKMWGSGHIDGTTGNNLLSFYYAEAWVTASLAGGWAQRIYGLTHDITTHGWAPPLDLIFQNISNLYGSNWRDRLEGDNVTNTIRGWDGDDRIYGLGGDDLLYGDAGTDQLYGDHGTDTLYGGAQDDELWGHRKAGILGPSGGASNDDGAGDSLNGGAGDDRMFGQGGEDRLDGGPGNDLHVGGADADTFIFADPGHEVSTFVDVIADYEQHDVIILRDHTLPGGAALTDIAQLDDNLMSSGSWWTGDLRVWRGDGIIDARDGRASLVSYEGEESLSLTFQAQQIILAGVTAIEADAVTIA